MATSIRSSFWNQGEICLCGSRIFVERSIHDDFVRRFAEAIGALAKLDQHMNHLPLAEVDRPMHNSPN